MEIFYNLFFVKSFIFLNKKWSHTQRTRRGNFTNNHSFILTSKEQTEYYIKSKIFKIERNKRSPNLWLPYPNQTGQRSVLKKNELRLKSILIYQASLRKG